MKPQVCIVHGGDTFTNDDEYRAALESKDLSYERLLYAPSWKNWLAEQLTGYDVLTPSMPNKQNAKYDEWAIYFSKVVPFLEPSATLVGHSLGGIFLAKYLSENPPATPYAKLILLAAPHSDESLESLGDFKLDSAKPLVHAAHEIHLMHSDDDPVVPISEVERYADDVPSAIVHRLKDKHHFIGSDLPELIDIINSTP